MLPALQHIKDLVQRSEPLGEEERTAIEKYLSDAQRELEVIQFNLEQAEKVNITTAVLLEANIEELEEKRKVVEQQERELAIESSLERIRARSMAMNASADLSTVVFEMFTELVKLDAQLDRCLILIVNPETNAITWYLTGKEGLLSNNGFLIPDNEHPSHKAYLEGWRNRRKKWSYLLAGQEKKDWDIYGFSQTELALLPDFIKADMAAVAAINLTISSDEFGCLIASSLSPLSDAHAGIVERFAIVFNQTYTRFLDLQRAEAQAREAQIEAALERVRSRSMAMHKSDELKEVIRMVLEQLVHLNIKAEHAGFYIDYKDKDDMHIWLADPNIEPFFAVLPYFDTPTWNSFLEAKAKGITLHTDLLDFETKNQFYSSLFELFTVPEEAKKFYMACKGLAVSTVLLDTVGLYIENFDAVPYTDDENNILMRFGKVFQQTYTRFLDLQRAEAQARESQIEAALERVRSRAMAMHSSGELNEVVHELRKQMGILGQKDLETCVIHLHDELPDYIQSWAAIKPPEEEGNILESIANVPQKGLMIIEEALDAYMANKKDYVIINKGEKLKQWFAFLEKESPEGFAMLKESVYGNIEELSAYWSFADFSGGSLLMVTRDGPDEPTRSLLRRFSNVFGLAYRRFADLKNAEAQAREAQVEAALERVRAKAMGMHTSQDFSDTVGAFYQELKAFSLTPIRCGVGLLQKESREAELFTWNTTFKGDALELTARIKMEGHPVLEQVYGQWLSQTDYLPVLRGNEIRDYYKVLRPMMDVPDRHNDDVLYGYFFFFDEGGVYAWTEKPMQEEEMQIYRRFKSVLSLTYKRYKDLQIAEAHAKEANRRASIDRVRAEIASMRTTDDLSRITPLIWNELKALGVPFFRCGVFIIHETEQMVHVYLSTPEGKSIARLHFAFGSSQLIDDGVHSWRTQQLYKIHWDRADFQQWVQTLMQQGQLQQEKQYTAGEDAPESLWLHFIPFGQGLLYVGSKEALSDGHLAMVRSLASSFATAYSRYEDFARLEAANRQIEHTLVELKATQSQLVQQEKLASLGQLTAGIAHEIKNPLNFVNNFAEVSRELIDEVLEELEISGNLVTDNIRSLLKDVQDNLDKVNDHGKRADGIVKSMLQHSRGGNGVISPTKLHALLEEFTQLSYHGMRAASNPISVAINFDFDEAVGMVPLIAEDFTRVVVNLCNNAFDAMRDKKLLKAPGEFMPTLWVRTRLEENIVLITFEDNGPGIPEYIKDKILQPFFTTKRGTEGTGLGLSISNDIIKAHRGTLNIESREGFGTTFHISIPIKSVV